MAPPKQGPLQDLVLSGEMPGAEGSRNEEAKSFLDLQDRTWA